MKFVNKPQNPVIYWVPFSLWGQAWTKIMEAFSWSFWHQECKNVGKLNQDHLRALLNMALDNLRGHISRIMVVCPQKKSEAMKYNEIHLSSCKDIQRVNCQGACASETYSEKCVWCECVRACVRAACFWSCDVRSHLCTLFGNKIVYFRTSYPV